MIKNLITKQFYISKLELNVDFIVETNLIIFIRDNNDNNNNKSFLLFKLNQSLLN